MKKLVMSGGLLFFNKFVTFLKAAGENMREFVRYAQKCFLNLCDLQLVSH